MNVLYNAHRAEMDYRISRISSQVLSARRARRLQRRQAKSTKQTQARAITRADLTRSA